LRILNRLAEGMDMTLKLTFMRKEKSQI
jgi:hypothetical protein